MTRPLPIARDLGLAGALAGVMTFGWAWVRGADLARLALPDGDDAVRLQQIRDWLGGQAFGDLTQYRIGVDGTAMHWSRLPDLVPAAMLKAGLGEPAMLVLWPALLFAAFLVALAQVARAIGARAGDAMILAALAYPATTLFAPGRIDHHGFQMVLLALFALGLVTPRALAGGALAGGAAALSLTIGMETAPVLTVGLAVATLGWLAGDRGRLAAIGASLLLTLAFAAAVFAPMDWASAPCDGFARASWRAGTIGGAALLTIGGIGAAFDTRRARLAVLAAVSIAALTALLATAPVCLSPYGAVDPALARIWLTEVGEAQPLFAADPRWAIGYAGLGLAALVAAAWVARDARRLTVAALVAAGLAVSLLQLRGAYAAAALAAPLLALALDRARAVSPLAALPVWMAGAGIAWPLAAAALPVADPPSPGPACDGIEQALAMRSLPPGRVLGPVDLGPWLAVATRHHAIAAPYHRNAAGNLASYRLLAADDTGARSIVRSVRAEYVVACPAALDTMRIKRGAGAAMVEGRPPAWLEVTGVPAVWRVR
ncbi:hypothetical protein COC42_12560 [Sphingomonas spermidinifaciens]|uniref:AcrB/AcrD/AcrF family protein n=1 Tax=Sphingomonas spermidinifaciens TaxID=1141889 RepID=A0A2A4AZA0_9SPHN|nr:hypothetical protein [Sphingomonas spermidinifaciens]PCD02273.1 hypothetical protein COC42_12560 [Sphingomonas spermidinifaciens]